MDGEEAGAVMVVVMVEEAEAVMVEEAEEVTVVGDGEEVEVVDGRRKCLEI